jgi:hypothetical protein
MIILKQTKGNTMQAVNMANEIITVLLLGLISFIVVMELLNKSK